MSKKSEPRQHHYVPRFLIARFADDRGKVHAYNRASAEYLYNQNPRKLLRYRDLYRGGGTTNDEQFSLERSVATAEAEWKDAIEQIVRQGHVPNDLLPTMSEFLAFQHLRTLRVRDDIRTVLNFYTTGMEISDLQKRVKAGEIQRQ